jgi:hypothetical protein
LGKAFERAPKSVAPKQGLKHVNGSGHKNEDCAGLVKAKINRPCSSSSQEIPQEIPVWHKNTGELSVFRPNPRDTEWALRYERPWRDRQVYYSEDHEQQPLIIPTGRNYHGDQAELKSTCLAKSKHTGSRLGYGGKDTQQVAVPSRRFSKETAEAHGLQTTVQRIKEDREPASPISKIVVGATSATTLGSAGPPDPAIWPYVRESHYDKREIVRGGPTSRRRKDRSHLLDGNERRASCRPASCRAVAALLPSGHFKLMHPKVGHS